MSGTGSTVDSDNPAPGAIGTRHEDRWTTSGLRELTGHPHEPGLDPPATLIARLDAVATALALDTAAHTRIDSLALLAERARILGLTRRGRISCGGGTRLLRASDGRLALSLTRPSDVELLPALLGGCPATPSNAPRASSFPGEGTDPALVPMDEAAWDAVAAQVALRSAVDLDAQAGLLGLALGVLGNGTSPGPKRSAPFAHLPVSATRLGDAPPRPVNGTNVVDLSSLWAGPLCGRLLGDAGADVTRIESATRPDGGRDGNPAFFDRLNGAKRHVRIDLGHREGRTELHRRVHDAAVVIEASRPRALAQLGIDAAGTIAGGPQVWVSITGYGRSGQCGNRIAFGDDAAVAGGLVARDTAGEPVFCADAIADPASGLVAAAAVAHALRIGGRWLIDVAMVSVAEYLAEPPTTRA